MPQKRKKKAQATEEEPEVKIITWVEVIYEDTKAIFDIDPEYKWGEICCMISNQSVPEAGFEDFPIYSNIEISAIMKVAARPDLFPCLEVIGWILPMVDVTRMILANTKGKGYAAYTPAYAAMDYKFLTP